MASKYDGLARIILQNVGGKSNTQEKNNQDGSFHVHDYINL